MYERRQMALRPPEPDPRLKPRTTPEAKPGKSAVEGVEHPAKLSGNENILGCSEAAREAYVAAAGRLNLYPDGRGAVLREAIAQRWRVEPERILLGCGTDEILHLINQVFLEPGDNIVQGQYAFGAYGIGARACQAEVRSAAEPHYRIDVDLMLELVDERTKLMFVTQPANPTGTYNTREELVRLHAGLPPSVVLVIDAAYAEFCTDPTFTDGLDLARGADNVIVTHTFSKIHGLAALRVGWGYAPAPIADATDRIRPPSCWVSHGRHCSTWASDLAWNVVSPSAATAAWSAGLETLNGGRMRSMASAIGAGA